MWRAKLHSSHFDESQGEPRSCNKRCTSGTCCRGNGFGHGRRLSKVQIPTSMQCYLFAFLLKLTGRHRLERTTRSYLKVANWRVKSSPLPGSCLHHLIAKGHIKCGDTGASSCNTHTAMTAAEARLQMPAQIGHATKLPKRPT